MASIDLPTPEKPPPLASELHPSAYCLLRLLFGISKLNGLMALIALALMPGLFGQPMMLICTFFLLVMLAAFALACFVMCICFMRYSLRTWMGVFLGTNALIACLFSNSRVLGYAAGALLLALAVVAIVEVAVFDPGYGPDAGRSDIFFLFDAFERLPRWRTMAAGTAAFFLAFYAAVIHLNVIEFWLGTALLMALIGAQTVAMVQAHVAKSRVDEV